MSEADEPPLRRLRRLRDVEPPSSLVLKRLRASRLEASQCVTPRMQARTTTTTTPEKQARRSRRAGPIENLSEAKMEVFIVEGDAVRMLSRLQVFEEAWMYQSSAPPAANLVHPSSSSKGLVPRVSTPVASHSSVARPDVSRDDGKRLADLWKQSDLQECYEATVLLREPCDPCQALFPAQEELAADSSYAGGSSVATGSKPSGSRYLQASMRLWSSDERIGNTVHGQSPRPERRKRLKPKVHGRSLRPRRRKRLKAKVDDQSVRPGRRERLKAKVHGQSPRPGRRKRLKAVELC